MNSLPKSPLEQKFDFETLVEKVSHLLPSQAPIRRFVHHNTLHHLEHLDFFRAVEEGAELLNCQPYPQESFFIEQCAGGRIGAEDIEAVLVRECEGQSSPSLPLEGWTRRDFQNFRLSHLFLVPQADKIRYLLEEGDLLHSIAPQVPSEIRDVLFEEGVGRESLTALWTLLLGYSPSVKVGLQSARPYEAVIHPFLIRFCAAYLDQGISYWPMPEKAGLYRSFLYLYSFRLGLTLPWQKGLADRLRRQLEEHWTSEKALEDAFARLKIGSEDSFGAIRDRALALRGWAGMVSALEKRPDLAPVECPPVSLLDYLAIYFQLEAHLKEQSSAPKTTARKGPKANYRLAYEAFVLAQCAGLDEKALGEEPKAKAWLQEVAQFHELKRRRLLLLAYERHYRNEILDAWVEHTNLGESSPAPSPRFQCVFCIDDREESLRRHLEESCEELETLGYAGFFGVCMTYQGLTDPHALPLCPPVRTPMHLVREVAVGGRQSASAQTIGVYRQILRASRNSILRGGVLAALPGFLAGFPLLGQTLFPSLSYRLASAIEHALSPPPLTRLKLERQAEEGANEDGLFEGFTVEEMVQIVKAGLQTMGVTRFASLFLLVGHGSSSLNNPHEAAHDCGATGGGRGGPNARAFAMMANHPQVRQDLVALGIEIPDSTWFVGAYHNTCDDSMVYYDLDLLPAALQPEMESLQALFLQACIMDAHERCRRFENVSLAASPKTAYRHVQARAVTLSQPRPEYGHCTNSLCIVGRRQRSRGLFLDRRAFLVSYDAAEDPDGAILGDLLEAVGPVGAGISLEYYFSSIDPSGYGCGTKLPHNVSGLLGVMDGHASDLRTGLPWQMVEIHEPMRLLNIVEVEPELLLAVLQQRPGLKSLLDKGWIQLVCQSPHGNSFWIYEEGQFQIYKPKLSPLSTLEKSQDYYQGRREHLPMARLRAGC